MRRPLLLLLALAWISLMFLSCGYSSPSSSTNTSGIKSRVFVSQDISGGNVAAGVEVIDAQTDTLFTGTLISGGATPGMMVVTPNRNQTLVFSKEGLTLSLIDNNSEQNAAHATLLGATQSIVVSPDSSTAYVAEPTASVPGQTSTGAMQVISLTNASALAEVSCFTPQSPPGSPCLPQIHSYQFLSINHSGNRILAFSNSADTVDPPPNPSAPGCSSLVPCYAFVITPSNIGTQTSPVTWIAGFDHPVAAFFSNDDKTAYVVSCGANCGGTTASVQKLDMTTDPPTPGASVSVPAAETATIVGTTMYLAGTPFSGGTPSELCTGNTQAKYCGLLTIFDLSTFTITNSNPIQITDGYHDHIAMGANGQLFVGAHGCTEILPSGGNKEIRGCIAIYNTQTGAVVVPSNSGDVTGLQPIANRHVVYVIQKNIGSGTPVGELEIFDTTTDKPQNTQVDISGDAVDVVAVDQ